MSLKRIEEKHRFVQYVRYGKDGGFCGSCYVPHPCDVVKLARALDANRQLAEEMAAKQDNGWLIWDALRIVLERTLKEVAGE